MEIGGARFPWPALRAIPRPLSAKPENAAVAQW